MLPAPVPMGSYGVNLIDDGLYIGAHFDELTKEQLLKEGITHVLQVASEVRPHHPHSFTYLHLALEDDHTEDLVPHFPRAFQFIETAKQAGGKVMVQCFMGISRSATFCIAYIMWKQQLELAEAFRRVKAVRRIICPNPGFMSQLERFEAHGCKLPEYCAPEPPQPPQPLIRFASSWMCNQP